MDDADRGDDVYQVGTARAGRLTRDLDVNEPDSMAGEDVGIDGAAAPAEEAAVHVIADGPDGT